MKKALPFAVFAAAAVWLYMTANLDGEFRIDEAHKISETYFLRLVERGDFRSPDWTSSQVERANPPVGKVVFGLAMQAAGVALPRDLTFAAHPDPRGAPPQFRSALRPARLVSLVATAGTAALACFLAGPIASILFLGSFLVQTHGTSAVFDPLLTFFILAAAAPVAGRVTWPRTVAAAVLAALAFDTRASGILALIGVLVLVRDWRKCLSAIGICFFVATALNPVYWSVTGYATQFHDLNALLAATGEHRLGPVEKVRFVSEYAFGDIVGLLTLIGVLMLALVRPRSLPPVLWWCLAVVVTFTAWLPVGYPRYVLVVIPAFAIAADYGWRSAITKVSTSLRERAKGK